MVYLKLQFSDVFRSSDFLLNPFLANIPILYPLKTPENQRLSGVFRGYKMQTLARNGLRKEARSGQVWYIVRFGTICTI